jgi:hypothetical protein
MNKRELKKWRESYTPWDRKCITEGLRLNVHFDEKDHLKRIGARWQPDPSGKGGYWWMHNSKLDSDMVTAIPALMPVIINTFELADSVKLEMEQNNYSGPTATGTVLEWLNTNKMVADTHGAVDNKACEQQIDNRCLTPKSWFMECSGQPDIEFKFFSELDIVARLNKPSSRHINTNYYTTADGRKIWDTCVESGYLPLTSQAEMV